MSIETKETICRWMSDTFPGGDPESPRKALRLLEEVVELCAACGASFGDMHTTLMAARAAHGWPDPKVPAPDPAAVPAEAADVQIVLYGLASLRGFDLAEEVDRKMAINRARRWMPRGDGTGYHVKGDDHDA